MGLRHPADLAAWRRWQERRGPLRALRSRVRPAPAAGVLTRGGPDADLLVVLDSTSPSNRAALLAPVRALPPERVLVLSPRGVRDLLPGSRSESRSESPSESWSESPWLGGPLPPVAAVLTAGHYLPLAAAAHAHATSLDVPSYVAQHGLLTPFNPPLAAGARLLAWSAADAEFWLSGRSDVAADVVGSQLLWAAAAEPARLDPNAAPVYLGQLHAAELPRRALAAAAEAFCRRTSATYRPHPSERDRRSRRAHRQWEAAGVRIDRSDRPLSELAAPVVSVFSTGVVEAAARGLPAAVSYPDPPGWLLEFWERYGLTRLVDPAAEAAFAGAVDAPGERLSAPALDRPAGQTRAPEPAAAIAAILERA